MIVIFVVFLYPGKGFLEVEEGIVKARFVQCRFVDFILEVKESFRDIAVFLVGGSSSIF